MKESKPNERRRRPTLARNSVYHGAGVLKRIGVRQKRRHIHQKKRMDSHVDLQMAAVDGDELEPGTGLDLEWTFDGTLDELNQHLNLDEWDDCP